ncbi:hypothetical protein EAO71_31860 [Streptomyces sp. ms191]|uniref:hypothetical protein n=1 Tax=unclassified Streptomyces TaxID=2593676 RepID=UPI0011CD464C|nr:hypothetical protein [Streptomyces sp. ms191]TXS21073.1 hypothetical protein EAO71_31860 [Streptomyces sp. ms191]
MADSPFPQDLVDAQLRLHQARAEYAALCRALPWSVEPADGWPGTKHPHTGETTGGREPSPGYTDEQKAEVGRLMALVRELTVTVSTHPHWATLDAGERMGARMALKGHRAAEAAPVADAAA